MQLFKKSDGWSKIGWSNQNQALKSSVFLLLMLTLEKFAAEKRLRSFVKLQDGRDCDELMSVRVP